MSIQASLRAAAVTMLTEYGQSAGLKLQVYPARPRTIYPPTAFVDTIHENIDWPGINIYQRTVYAEVILIHGLFDSKDAADQKDRFADEFLAWVADNPHAAGANTLTAVVGMQDIPAYTPDWTEAQASYYATQITLQGYAENNG